MDILCTRRQRPTTNLHEAAIVFIVDGDAAMRKSLESLVRAAGWEASTAASADEFLARPRDRAPCCLLVEQHLPGSSGLDLQDRLCGQTDMPVVFMSTDADVPAIVRAMKAGALEFLAKPLDTDALLKAIGHAIQRSRMALCEMAEADELAEHYELLSRREREVMHRVVAGRLNKQTGGDLGISEITVKAHRGQVMRKMRARSLPELVRMAASLRRNMPALWLEEAAPARIVSADPLTHELPAALHVLHFASSRPDLPSSPGRRG